ncbi:MAG: prepilin-type N-terminal cleavage/methylation domain-containing protein [Thiobacillaceae bacterium]
MTPIKHFTSCRGFSLIEMIIAITVLGILSASTAVFLRGPIASYFDTERRADMADSGELAMAKLSQEISGAVPNSVRIAPIAGGGFYLEFLPVRSTNGLHSEGRYRIAGPGNVLSFGVPDAGFDALTPVQVQAGDFIVVNNYRANTYLNPGPDTDVWAGNTRAVYFGVNGSVTNIGFLVPHLFPPEPLPLPVLPDAPEHRFQVASGPVTYFCNPVAGTLTRYNGYAISPVQPQPPAGVPVTLAARISACSATFSPGNLRHAGVVALSLTFNSAGDMLSLYHTIRIEPLP